jgi:uncharacterized protein YdeI (YjbR/CyaY-like superfamily)
MTTTDKRVDTYIAKAPDYAKPILTAVRAMIHEGAPDSEETIKWGHPAFIQNGMLCGMAAFKEYCAINFWKATLVIDPDARQTNSAGVLGKITKVKDLPPKRVFVGYVKRAVEVNASGLKVPRAPAKPKSPLPTPKDFRQAIDKSAQARQAFESLSPSHRREYIQWITEAKQDSTRARRIAQAVEWMAEGKPRNWKYMKS